LQAASRFGSENFAVWKGCLESREPAAFDIVLDSIILRHKRAQLQFTRPGSGALKGDLLKGSEI
jgi:hypothetical protein